MLPAWTEKWLRLLMLAAVLCFCLCVPGCGPEIRMQRPGPLMVAAAAVCVAVLAVLRRRGGS
jgi:hypothetical protein